MKSCFSWCVRSFDSCDLDSSYLLKSPCLPFVMRCAEARLSRSVLALYFRRIRLAFPSTDSFGFRFLRSCAFASFVRSHGANYSRFRGTFETNILQGSTLSYWEAFRCPTEDCSSWGIRTGTDWFEEESNDWAFQALLDEANQIWRTKLLLYKLHPTIDLWPTILHIGYDSLRSHRASILDSALPLCPRWAQW